MTIKEKVINDDAEIYCERRGNGPVLLLIHGAMEDAGYYSSAADILSGKFTVLSYDRLNLVDSILGLGLAFTSVHKSCYFVIDDRYLHE